MKFNSAAVKATLFSMLVTASSTVFAHNFGDNNYRCERTPPHCFPTPTCYPTPTPPIHNGVSPVPEPSSWISFAIGAVLLVALAVYNNSKFAKAND